VAPRGLAREVRWRRIPVGSGAAAGVVPLPLGEVGRGGPVALIAAGVHGDEGPWGSLAIRHLLRRLAPERLIGTLRLLPVANPLAMEANRRCAPLDSLDLNRCFPGDPGGSHTEMLAHAIAQEAIAGADVAIDLHGGGSWAVNAFAFRFAGSEELAEAVGAPLILDNHHQAMGPVTLTTCARARGARVVAIEMGGHSAAEDPWAERIAQGVERVLVAAGVLTPSPDLPPAPRPLPIGPSAVLRPRRGGILVPHADQSQVGTVVPGGTLLGELRDPATWRRLEAFRAPFPRTALMLLRPMLAVLEAGAMTYVVADPDAAPSRG